MFEKSYEIMFYLQLKIMHISTLRTKDSEELDLS